MKAVYLNEDGSITPDKHGDSLVFLKAKWHLQSRMEYVESEAKRAKDAAKHGLLQSFESSVTPGRIMYDPLRDSADIVYFKTVVTEKTEDVTVRLRAVKNGRVHEYKWPFLKLKQATK